MPAASIRIGNQTNCHVPARLPYEFAVAHGFDAFEWFSDKGRWGWCEDDMPAAERVELRRTARQRGMLFSVHAPVAADPTTPSGAEAIRRSIRFGGDVGAGVVNLHLFPEHGPKLFAEALRPLLDVARSTGVRLCLENTPQTSPDHVNALFGCARLRCPRPPGRSVCASIRGTRTCSRARATITSGSWTGSRTTSPSFTGTPMRTGVTGTAI